MSVFHLTFSYARPYIAAGKEAADLSLKQKGLILKILISLFVIFVSANLYFSGAVVSKTAERAALSAATNEALQRSGGAEAAFVAANYGKNLEYFLAQGYEEPKNLEIIKNFIYQ
ncbi:hypothetical protein A2661_02475 [Candidatus Giovannonibacteria bacterium RIFCSPHIGHO2_01_FULL_45_24]|uniref:Uncharacterized protein n=1 Tax=Candidatus Giovannonibacteria bacterium RIFCSPLOWO2_01_FULL_46_32 TaxID=1798353 RepID=A0A1F5XG83_9BACT|nr:MAG: hypothetical protein A2661_02475 [Candidatus Giovannonibacteria bacterium RIFCSPHIGHO2_01_FULL_45_24]OGF86867.1 MAG: hypothetical protein A3B19_02245 [Candidatus Giovannonibacteria bacterium RIFCSPLOWO2_01_FULL_46_32]